jgi:cysteine desulfurase/selenocysteine lyase
LGVKLVWVDTEPDGSFDEQKVINAFTSKTKLVAITHMSNVLGTRVDVKKICNAAKSRNIPVLIDGSQAAVHLPIDVQDIGCDFYAITGHKLYGPSASGAIYISEDRMAEMTPFMGGGDMIKEVHKEIVTYNDPPMIMEAGTPGIVQLIGLGVALEYMQGIGMANIALHENHLKKYAHEKLSKLEWLRIQGNDPDKAPIFSFTIDGAGHAHDISTVLDKRGICVRAGHHCAQPLMEHLGVSATCRASFGLYNTLEEVDSLVNALELCHELFS